LCVQELNIKSKKKKKRSNLFTHFNSSFTHFPVSSEHRLVPVSSQTCSWYSHPVSALYTVKRNLLKNRFN